MFAQFGMWCLKAAAVWIALLAGTILGGMIGGGLGIAPPAHPDGPLSSGAAFLVVAALHALVLAGLAAWSRLVGVRLGLFLFVVMFAAQAVLMQIETLFFAAHVGLPPELIPRILLRAGFTAALAAAVAALLFRSAPTAPTAIDGLVWRLPAVAVVYVSLYFGAGYCIAWQFPALRAYYAEGADIALLPLIVVQLGRGLLWAALAWLLVRNLHGRLAVRAALAALAFCVFGVAQLLYPNPFMPWAVRWPHLLEVGVANTLFGLIASALLLGALRRLA